MVYPDNEYPQLPDFPAGTNRLEMDITFLTVTSRYLSDIINELLKIIDEDGNLKLSSTQIIKWASGASIANESNYVSLIEKMVITNTLQREYLSIVNDVTTNNISIYNLNLSGNLTVNNVNTSIAYDAIINMEQTAEPDNPELDNDGIIWLSNGIGAGDAGDLMIKIKYNDIIKTVTLIDFSEG